MRRFALFLFAFAGVVSSLHASTIVTDTVVFTYSTSAGTEQNNFSFLDGVMTSTNVHGNFDLPVTVYPNTDQLGTPTAAEFFNDDYGNVGLFLSGGPSGKGVSISGYNSGGYLASQAAFTYSGTDPVFVTMYMKLGTYQLTQPVLQFHDTMQYFSLDSASFTVTQTTTVTPDPVAVTPEPSTLALLGTGLLGLCGEVRRRRSTAVA